MIGGRGRREGRRRGGWNELRIANLWIRMIWHHDSLMKICVVTVWDAIQKSMPDFIFIRAPGAFLSLLRRRRYDISVEEGVGGWNIRYDTYILTSNLKIFFLSPLAYPCPSFSEFCSNLIAIIFIFHFIVFY